MLWSVMAPPVLTSHTASNPNEDFNRTWAGLSSPPGVASDLRLHQNDVYSRGFVTMAQPPDIIKILERNTWTNVNLHHSSSMETGAHLVMSTKGSADVIVTTSMVNDSLNLLCDDATVQGGCQVLQTKDFNPWNNTDNIISHTMEFWIVTVNSVGLIPLLYFVGAPCNILCIAVFYRLGLRDRINVCLFALALVDLLTITIIFLQSVEEGYRKLIACTNFIIRYLVGLTGFTWASQFVSTVITCERCFCVVSPFKAQRYLKTSTMAAIITVVCLILVGGMCAVAGHKYVSLCTKGPAISDSGKSTYFTEYYLDNKRILDIIDIFIYATAFPIIILIINVIATAVTTVKVRHAAEWRLHSANNNLTPPHGTTAQIKSDHSVKEVALTKMLIVTSIIFIVCLTPNVMVQIAIFLVKDLNYDGKYANMTSVLWTAISFLRMINSSLNFFVYLKMGSRFRETVHKLIPCRGLGQT